MIEIVKSATFEKWLSGLKDHVAVARILARIRRLQTGNFGDSKMLREGVSELRKNMAPVTGCISCVAAQLWWCYWRAATKAHKVSIFPGQSRLPQSGRIKHG